MAFAKGTSGNPAGRTRGSKNTSTKLREKLEKELPSILRKLVAQAIEGDVGAAKLILDRALPPLRPEAASVKIPGVQGSPLSERAGAILVAIAEGRIPPDIGASLLNAMASTVRIIKVGDLVRRLEALEVDRGTD